MMKSKKLHLVLLFTILSTAVTAQDDQAKVNAGQMKVLHIQLYRGIVEVTPTVAKDISWTHDVLDYDQHDQGGKRINHKESHLSRHTITVEEKPDTIRIFNETSRELQSIKINIPKHLTVKIEIQHFGIIQISETDQPVILQVFNGAIEIENSSSSVSATVIREGSISLKSTANSFGKTIALSSYNGDISYSSTSQNSTYLIKTDLGEIINSRGLSLQRDSSVEFKQKEGQNTSNKKAYWYQAKEGNGKGPNVMIVNTQGKIILNQN